MENKRREDRKAVAIDASVVIDGTDHACRLKNISSGGAQIVMDNPPCKGTVVVLHIDPFGSVRGDVAWHSSKASGIKFDDDDGAVEGILLGLVSSVAL